MIPSTTGPQGEREGVLLVQPPIPLLLPWRAMWVAVAVRAPALLVARSGRCESARKRHCECRECEHDDDRLLHLGHRLTRFLPCPQ
jgi:hypothetical protein